MSHVEQALLERIREQEIALAEARNAFTRMQEEFELALEGIERIVSSTGKENALDSTLATVCSILHGDAAFLLAGDNQSAGQVLASTDPRWKPGLVWPWAGPFLRALRGQGVVCHDVQRVVGWPATATKLGVHCCLLVPVQKESSTAVLVVTHPARGALAMTDLELARQMTPVLSTALESAENWRWLLAAEVERASRSEAQRAYLDNQHRLLLSSMQEAVFMESFDGSVAVTNPAFSQLFSLSAPEELSGTPAWELTQNIAECFADPEDFLQRTRATAQLDGETCETLVMQDGRVLERCTHAVDDADGTVGRMWLYRDVTARVQAARSLEEALSEAQKANQAKRDFLASVSHEIRTPLNAILGMTSMLMETPLSAEQEDLLRTVRGSSSQLHHLLSELLDFSRIEAGALELVDRPVDVGQLVEAVVDGFSARAIHLGLWLRVAIEPEVGWIRADANRLRQIVTNFVSNALKYTPKGGVEVRVSGSENDVTIAVLDTGPGITPELKARLFQRYSQGARGGLAASGVGLGLYISHSLALAMGGTITVSSTQGRGSEFRFILPRPRFRETERPLAGSGVCLVGVPAEIQPFLATQLRSLGARVCTEIRSDARFVVVGDKVSREEVRTTRPADQRIVSIAPHGAPVPPWAHAAVRPPITRQGLRRALLPQSVNRGKSGTQRGRVLLAEDDPINLTIFSNWLAAMNVDVHSATNGRLAVEMANARRFDLILMDIHMPELDGIEATRQIRQAMGPEVPIVALTGHATAEIQQAAHAVGMQGFLTKPVSQEMLTAIVDEHLVQGPFVLVVDDDPPSRRLLRYFIERLKPGVWLTEAGDGAAALDAIQEQTFDIVLMDVEMPGLDGISCAQELRRRESELPHTQRTRLIALTGHDEPETMRAISNAGFDQVFTKPVSPETLQAILFPKEAE